MRRINRYLYATEVRQYVVRSLRCCAPLRSLLQSQCLQIHQIQAFCDIPTKLRRTRDFSQFKYTTLL
ncbi:MAG: hypothetical protein KME46_17990 [Brasilonema angustatum HA4187-MV1]|nr:hypothetical protein [Brasilonema angustatum HA4187-MV1]